MKGFPFLLALAFLGYSQASNAQTTRAISPPSGIGLSLVPAVVQPAPSNLTATSGYRSVINCCQVDLVRLSWRDNSSNEYSFRVERCAGATCTNFVEVLKTAPNTTHATQGFYYQRGRIYRYRVRARGPYGFSAYTNLVTVKLP